MALFTEGNQFWRLRSKHGRDKIFETPDLLWEAACEYFEWCENNPLMETDFRGKDADEVHIPKMRAFTWDGLELFVDIYSLRDYKKNPTYADFSQIIIRIEKIIYNQKYTGAAAGFLNQNIIARDLGLIDRKDITTNGEEINSEIDLSKVSVDVLKILLDAASTTEDKPNAG